MYKWIRESQFTDYGLMASGHIFDPNKLGIHPDIIANWKKDGWIKKVKLEKETPTKEVKENGRHRKKTK
jgi:glycine cleavage system H lipoate-binding protein